MATLDARSCAADREMTVMPVLDAKALENDPEGMELLRSVLQTGRGRKRLISAAPGAGHALAPVKETARPPVSRPPAAIRLAEACH